MSDIAREAGVSVGHLYNFFESRDAIVEVFAQRELDKLREKNRFYRESNLSEEEICRQSVYELALTKLDKTAARLTFEILSESVVNPRIQRAVKTYDAASVALLHEKRASHAGGSGSQARCGFVTR